MKLKSDMLLFVVMVLVPSCALLVQVGTLFQVAP